MTIRASHRGANPGPCRDFYPQKSTLLALTPFKGTVMQAFGDVTGVFRQPPIARAMPGSGIVEIKPAFGTATTPVGNANPGW